MKRTPKKVPLILPTGTQPNFSPASIGAEALSEILWGAGTVAKESRVLAFFWLALWTLTFWVSI